MRMLYSCNEIISYSCNMRIVDLSEKVGGLLADMDSQTHGQDRATVCVCEGFK